MTTRIRAGALCVVCDRTAVTAPNRWYTTECHPSQLTYYLLSSPGAVYGRARAREEKIDGLLKDFGRGLKYLRYFLTDFSENLRIPSPITPPNTHQGG